MDSVNKLFPGKEKAYFMPVFIDFFKQCKQKKENSKLWNFWNFWKVLRKSLEKF